MGSLSQRSMPRSLRARARSASGRSRRSRGGKINVTGPDSRNPRRDAEGCRAMTPRPSSAKARSSSPPRSASSRWTAPACSRWSGPQSAKLEAVGVTDAAGVVLADAGYWKNDAIQTLASEGIPTLVAPDADRRKEPGPVAAAGATTSPAPRTRRSRRRNLDGGCTGHHGHDSSPSCAPPARCAATAPASSPPSNTASPTAASKAQSRVRLISHRSLLAHRRR